MPVLARTAIWLALPSDSAEQIVSRVEAAPRVASASAASDAYATDGSRAAERTGRRSEACRRAEANGQLRRPSKSPPRRRRQPRRPPPCRSPCRSNRWTRPIPAGSAQLPAMPRQAQPRRFVPRLRRALQNRRPWPAPMPRTTKGADNAATAAIPTAKPAQDAGQPDRCRGANQPPRRSGGERRTSGAHGALRHHARQAGRSMAGCVGTVPGRANVQAASCASLVRDRLQGVSAGFVYRKFCATTAR